MKKILVLLILSYGQLVALDKDSTLKIYHHIFTALSSKTSISVYTEDIEYRKVFAYSKRITLSKEPQRVDIVLVTNKTMLDRVMTEDTYHGTIIFVTDYRLLKESVDIVGAFYWKKGRTQLLFIKNRLQAKNITLPLEYEQYIIDEL